MRRNLIIGAVVVAGIVSACTGQDVSDSQTTATVTQSVAEDRFTDNRRGGMWMVYQNEPNNCQVKEANGRLEFTSTENSYDAFAGYISDGWWIDPHYDFKMKVDLVFDRVQIPGAWVEFGVTLDPNKPFNKYIIAGAGSSSGASNYWHEYNLGAGIRSDFHSRYRERVTLYISYTRYYDELYISDSGYGPDQAWQTHTYVIWGEWEFPKLYLFLGGNAGGALVEAGHAYIDDFVIEEGVIGGKIKPNPPADKPDKPNPDDPSPGEDDDVTSSVVIQPSIIKRNETSKPVTAVVTLSNGVKPEDIDSAEPLILMPGSVKSKKQSMLVWLDGQVVVIGSFDRAELMQAIPENGVVELQLIGTFMDGSQFGGSYQVTVR